MFYRSFAHAGEIHETMTQSTIHSLFSKWYVALLFLAIFLLAIGRITYFISRRSFSAVYVVLMVALLVIGLLGYRLSAVLSIVSISGGFAMSLIQMVAGILEDKPKRNVET